MVVSLLNPQSISTVQCIVCKKRRNACCKISCYFFSFIPIHFNHIYLANL